MIFIFVFENFPNSFSWGPSFGPFWSAKYLNWGGESCEIRILPCLTQETYTLKNLENQLLLFLPCWKPSLPDCTLYRVIFFFFFVIISKGKVFRANRKNPYIFNYWWAGVSNYVYSKTLVITKIYIFILYFTLVLLLIMRSQPASTEWTITSTAAFSYCWSYTEHSDVWLRYVAYTWY